jgi:hypothetical protein
VVRENHHAPRYRKVKRPFLLMGGTAVFVLHVDLYLEWKEFLYLELKEFLYLELKEFLYLECGE